ncbi:MAG: cytochrome c [bacterium]|nr:cytochrome c [bacterium]
MKKLLLSIGCLLALGGCMRGTPSDKPPIHMNPNMDDQSRYDVQSKSPFFADSATMRIPPAGTVARGFLRENDALHSGTNPDGSLFDGMPVPITMQLLQRGQERYNIFCSPCHGRTGDGKGIVVNRGLLPPPSFHEQRLVDTANGYIFNVITNGIRNMPPYRFQVSVEDRWAIIAYFRALQRSHAATINDVPQEMRGTLK